MQVTIRDFKVDAERFGENSDVYYTLILKEYRPPKVTVKEPAAKTTTTVKASSSANTQAASVQTYTVVKNDSLWKIAKKFYGNGAQWRKIYNVNKSVVGGNPNLIYPGQKLVIPK